MDVPTSFHWPYVGILQVLTVCPVDCCSTVIAFSQYVQEASFEEVDRLVKIMTKYKGQCSGEVTLPDCPRLTVSKLFAFLKQTNSFVNTENLGLENIKKETL